MKQLVYVIQDNVSQQSSPLFLAPNDDRAKLQFGTFLTQIPFDRSNYDLYALGFYDSEPNPLLSMPQTVHVINGAALDENIKLDETN